MLRILLNAWCLTCRCRYSYKPTFFLLLLIGYFVVGLYSYGHTNSNLKNKHVGYHWNERCCPETSGLSNWCSTSEIIQHHKLGHNNYPTHLTHHTHTKSIVASTSFYFRWRIYHNNSVCYNNNNNNNRINNNNRCRVVIDRTLGAPELIKSYLKCSTIRV